ncbi:MAG TPA: PepSY-associated TM helix domain-containing protein [Planctomycetota bacterium]|nr:PepSY-associated TM helix domain-containing protein [Planctomycetota bacterium]
MLRRIIFWSHLSIGLAAGVFIFLLCLSGAILAFELQLVAWVEHDVRARPPQADSVLLSPTELATRVVPAPGERIVSLEWSADQDMPVRVLTDQRTVTLLNGYTGEVLGPGATTLRGFLRWVTSLHTNLVLETSGHWLVAIANAGFVFLIVSGLWLWWPRQWRWNQWHWQAFRVALTPRLRLKGKARDWNWHTTLGFWFLVPLLIIAATGMVLSFAAVNQ